jgi:hypothetical protein
VLEMPPAIHEIIAYTDLLEVRGEVTAWPPRRILDVLNGEQTPYLTVEQASVIPLSQWGKGEPATVQSVVLNKSEVILVWLVRETTVEPPESVTVHKVPQRVIVYTGPFVVQGSIHVLREGTLTQALDAMREAFIAVTDPSLLCLSAEGLALKGGIVLGLNKERLMAMQVGE